MVNLDKVLASYNGNIESIKCASNLSNGNVVALGALDTDQREVFTAVAPTALTDEVLLHATPEVMYEVGKSIADFVLVAGKVGRAYHLNVGDIITFADADITGTSAVGEFLAPAIGSFKLSAKSTVTTERVVLQVIEKGTIGFDKKPATVGRVIKC